MGIEIQDKKVTTPVGRFSYIHFHEPKTDKKGKDPRWEGTLLIDKSENLIKMKKAAMNAALEKFGSKDNFPKKLKWPFKDGDKDEDADDAYKGTIYVSCRNKKKAPKVCDMKKNLLNKDDVKSGDYGRFSLLAFYYDFEGKKGISFALLAVQKTEDGEALGGGGGNNLENDFEFDEDADGDFSEMSESDADDDFDNEEVDLGF